MACTVEVKNIVSSHSTFTNWLRLQPNGGGATPESGPRVNSVGQCLQSLVDDRGSLHNRIHESQDNIKLVSEQITQEEANAAIAKDRVSYIRNPERNTSNYESWFPIDRPMHTVSLIIILSITIFIGTFLLCIIASALGLDIKVYMKQSTTFMNRGTWYYWIYSQFTPLTIGSLIVLVSVILYFVYR